MPVEIIGMIGVKPEGADGAAVHVIGGAIDTRWVRDFAQAHEQAGFDRVLVGYTSTSAEGFAVTGYVAAHTERLRGEKPAGHGRAGVPGAERPVRGRVPPAAGRPRTPTHQRGHPLSPAAQRAGREVPHERAA